MSIPVRPVAMAVALAAAGLLLLLALQGGAQGPLPSGGGGHDHASHSHAGAGIRPTWAMRATSVDQLANRAPVAVVAEVNSVRPGPELADDSKAHPGLGLPTERISFNVREGVYGDVPETFDLFRVGSASLAIEGDPAYKPGERYLLFVEPRVDGTGQREIGTYVPISPDGRLRVAEGRVNPTIDGDLGQRLRGRPLAEVKSEARSARKGG
jgi:hypothetical protein